jgi:hypothetical protein
MRPRVEKDKMPRNGKSNTSTNVKCNARLGMLFVTIMRCKSRMSNTPTNARRNARLGMLFCDNHEVQERKRAKRQDL